MVRLIIKDFNWALDREIRSEITEEPKSVATQISADQSENFVFTDTQFQVYSCG